MPHTQASPTTGPTPAAALAAEGQLAEQIAGTQRHLSEMTLNLANEVMGFASRRMQAQVAFMAELGRCTDPAALFDAQLRFMAEATSDYATEMTTLAKVAQPPVDTH